MQGIRAHPTGQLVEMRQQERATIISGRMTLALRGRLVEQIASSCSLVAMVDGSRVVVIFLYDFFETEEGRLFCSSSSSSSSPHNRHYICHVPCHTTFRQYKNLTTPSVPQLFLGLGFTTGDGEGQGSSRSREIYKERCYSARLLRCI